MTCHIAVSMLECPHGQEAPYQQGGGGNEENHAPHRRGGLARRPHQGARRASRVAGHRRPSTPVVPQDAEGRRPMSVESQDASPVRRARGDGSIFQKRYTDKRTGETKKTDMLYMKFYVGGKPVVEPTGTTNRNEAKKLLRRRLGEIASGRYIPADVDKTTFGQVKQMALDHYRANGRRSLDRFEDAVSHLSAFFP